MQRLGYFHARYSAQGAFSVISLMSLCALGLWLLAPVTVSAQNTVQRDPQALTIIKQTIAASGGQQLLSSIQDFTETGMVTYNFADPVTGNVTLKCRGLHQLRIDADLPKGRRTTVVNGGNGSLKEADGRTVPIYRQSAADLGSLGLPYLALIAATRESTDIIYGGLVAHNGASAYDIRLQRVYTARQDPTKTRGVSESRDFYIDPKTFLVSAVSDHIHFKVFDDGGVPHEILYSNYQPENGIMVPLAIVETIRDLTGFTMNLNQVAFNSSLPDSEFSW